MKVLAFVLLAAAGSAHVDQSARPAADSPTVTPVDIGRSADNASAKTETKATKAERTARKHTRAKKPTEVPQ